MMNILIAFIALTAISLGWEILWWILGVKPLLPWQLRSALRKRPEDFALIDVRTAAEYAFFHINGAESRPELLLQPDLFEWQRGDKSLVVICLTGHRSSLASHRLRKRGYTGVYNLTFGMLGWLLSGGKTIRKKRKKESEPK